MVLGHSRMACFLLGGSGFVPWSLDLNTGYRNMATVRVPDAEQPVYPSPNTAGPQATESSAAFCLGRPCGRIWGNCELQRFWVYCTVTPVQENNPANYFTSNQGTGFSGACLTKMNCFQALLRRQENMEKPLGYSSKGKVTKFYFVKWAKGSC